ncbi:MAG: pyridoxal-phosphate dependent enzyme [Candidatus Berkelbacteria bacterium]|nr:pyridoxal-phosphate dependent enzyme [Candidatus Berkelbacteria bacterium]
MNTIGNTPLKLINLTDMPSVRIWAKLEYLNPTGSHKDRAYLSMVEDLESRQKLPKNAVLVDYTSGNGGAALAHIAKLKGYRSLVVIPAQMSSDKIEQIKKCGGRVIKIPSKAKYGHYGSEDMLKARLEAARIAATNPKRYFFLDQGENPANKAAFEKLGLELLDASKNMHVIPDAIIIGIGTGGTITGVGKIFRDKFGKNVKIIGVEPAESSVLSARKTQGSSQHLEHNLSGLGIGTREANVDLSLIDEIVSVDQKEWLSMLRTANRKGYPVGKSSAACLAAIDKVCQSNPDIKKVFTIFFDTIDKYKSERLLETSPASGQIDYGTVEGKYGESWDALFADQSFKLRTSLDPEIGTVQKSLLKNGISKILSVPCGDFYNETFLAEHGIGIDGIDISKRATDTANMAIRKKKLKNCSVSRADFLSAKPPSSPTYGAVLALDIAMHWSDETISTFLDRLSLYTKTDGLLFVNFLSPEDDTFSLGDKVGPKVRSVRNGEIIIHYRDLPEIEELFSTSQFVIKTIKPYRRTEAPHSNFRKETKKTHTHRGYFVTAQKLLSNIPETISDLKRGRPCIVIDHREKEGDFFIPSDRVTPSLINTFLALGRGVLCVSLLPERFRELGLGYPSIQGIGYNETRFGDPVDLMFGTTTGISADDRAKTITSLLKASTKHPDLRVPGHVRTLEAMKGGLRERSGHTEASIELAKLAGSYPSGTLIEILNRKGKVATTPELVRLARKENIRVVTINQIKQYLVNEL